MTERQRLSVIKSIKYSTVVAIIIFAVWVVLGIRGTTSPRYGFQISAITQGASKQASLRASRVASKSIADWVASVRLMSTPETSQIPAILISGSISSNWITVVHFSVVSPSLNRLNELQNIIDRQSRWRVRDINKSGQFVRVQLRPGVTVLRLAEVVGTADRNVTTRLQISGPAVMFSLADVLTLCLIVLLVIGFGATEHNDRDVFAFPRGMHPVVISSQIMMLALFACFLITYKYAAPPTKSIGVLLLDAAVCVSILRWLWVSKQHWNGPNLLHVTRSAIIASSGAITMAGVVIAIGL